MKKMKLILEYNDFLKKYKKINEGGGAGKEIKFDDFEFELKFSYKNGKLELLNKSANIGDKLDIKGYQDGMENISTEDLFETEITYKLDEKLLGDLTIGQIEYYNLDIFNKEDDKNKTLRELSDEVELKISVYGSGEMKKMYGSGYILSMIDKDDILHFSMGDLNDGYDSYINDRNIYDCLDKYCGLSIDVSLKATEKMQQLWEDLFKDDETYDDYLNGLSEDEKEDSLSEDDFYQQKQDDLKINYGIDN
jgi:hypothetical protein